MANSYRSLWRLVVAAGAARREAARNRRQAERLEPRMLEAFERAIAQCPDPLVAAKAEFWLAQIYAEIPDLDKQVAVLRRILDEHGELHATAVFGLGGTPHYYCYYALAAAYQRMGQRAQAVEALARARLAIEARAKAGGKVGYAQAQVLGRLLNFEPRVVLPQYRRMLPPGTDELLRRHEASAPTRITLTVERADRDGVLVRYEVLFPAYPAIIKAREEEQLKPRVHIAFPAQEEWVKPVRVTAGRED